VCSTRDARLARIGRAINEVAAAARAGVGAEPNLGDLAGRLADIWAMVAEEDPALTARLRGYCPDSD